VVVYNVAHTQASSTSTVCATRPLIPGAASTRRKGPLHRDHLIGTRKLSNHIYVIFDAYGPSNFGLGTHLKFENEKHPIHWMDGLTFTLTSHTGMHADFAAVAKGCQSLPQLLLACY